MIAWLCNFHSLLSHNKLVKATHTHMHAITHTTLSRGCRWRLKENGSTWQAWMCRVAKSSSTTEIWDFFSSWLYFMHMGEKINLHHSLLQNNDINWKDITLSSLAHTFTPTILSRRGKGNSLQTFRKYCVCWQHAHPYSSISSSLIPQKGERDNITVHVWVTSLCGEGDFLQLLNLYIQKLIIKVGIPSPLLSAQSVFLFSFAQELERLKGCIFFYKVCRVERLWLLYNGALISSEAGVWYYALKKIHTTSKVFALILFVCPTILSVSCLKMRKGGKLTLTNIDCGLGLWLAKCQPIYYAHIYHNYTSPIVMYT